MSSLDTALTEARRLHSRLQRLGFSGDVQGYPALELKQATIEAGALVALLTTLAAPVDLLTRNPDEPSHD